MIRRRISALTLALALAGTALLSGCGSDDEGDNTDSTSSESEDTTTEESEEPTETESEEAPEDEADGDKPSKQEVITGYNELITGQMSSLPKETVNQVTTCFVDEVYDDASVQTLQAIADADAQGIDPADASLFADAQTVCTEELAG